MRPVRRLHRAPALRLHDLENHHRHPIHQLSRAVTSATNVVVTVDQANLALDCAALQLVGTPAVTYALTKDPSVRPILVDIQTAVNGALHAPTPMWLRRSKVSSGRTRRWMTS